MKPATIAMLRRNRRTDAFERRIAARLAPLEGAAHGGGPAHGGGATHGSGGVPVVVACSGGADSLATLVAVARGFGAGRVVAAFFDHRLRPVQEIEAERAVVEQVAAQLHVPVAAGRAEHTPASDAEAAARVARYRWLARACAEAGAAWCVTGHTLDDQAETVLLRLARGVGAAGAAGMAVESAWPVPLPARLPGVPGGMPRLLRPLLEVTRGEVEAYLDALGLPSAGVHPAQDPSNASLGYARNRVRRRVLPELREVNQRAAEHLARFAALQREDDEALTALARAWLDQHGRTIAGGVELDRAALRQAPPALARRAVRLAASRLGTALEARHIEAILGSLGRKGARVDLPVAYSESGATVLTLRARPSPTGTD